MNDFFSGKDLSQLVNKTVAIVGYQSDEGRLFAEYLRNQGIHVIIGLGAEDDNWKKAQQDGYEVFTIWDSVQNSDIVQVW